jgi:transcriptional regulator of acetoin/glycerol metabolism
VQHRLSDIEDTINREQENVKSLTAAKRDLLRRESEQAIDAQRQTVETQKSQLRTQMNQSLEELKDLRERVLDHLEREYLRGLLVRCRGNITAVAQCAGLDRSYVHRLVRKHEL